MDKETIDQLIREALGCKEEPIDIDKSLFTSAKVNDEEEKDYSVLKKRLEELKAKYGK